MNLREGKAIVMIPFYVIWNIGDVLEVCEGRTHEDVVKMLKRLDNPKHVEAVSMDMSGSFRGSVRSCSSSCGSIVADHFHVIQHVEKAFSKVLNEFAQQRR